MASVEGDTVTVPQSSMPAHKGIGLGAALFLLIFAIHLAFALFCVGTVMQGDESGYLMNAAAMVGYRTAAYSSYYAGYSLFLIPAFLLSHSPATIYLYTHVINALLWATTGLFSCLIIDALRGSRTRAISFLGALIVGCYPSFLVFSAMAFSENAFVLVGVMSAWLLVKAASWQSRRYLWAFLATAAFSMLIHPLGIALLVAAIVVGYIALGSRVRPAMYWLVMVPAVVCAELVVHYGLRHFLKHQLSVGNSILEGHYPSILGFIAARLGDGVGLAFLWRAIFTLAGQIFYLLVATLGLACVGFIWCVDSIRRHGRNSPEFATAAFALAAFALTAAICVLSTMNVNAQDARSDFAIYGRYNEGVLALLLIPSLLAITYRKGVAIALGVAILCALCVFIAKGNVISGTFIPSNIAGVGTIVQYANPRADSLELLYLFVYAIAAIALLLIFSRWKYVVSGIVIVLFLAQALGLYYLWIVPSGHYRDKQRVLVHFTADHFSAVNCVNFDEKDAPVWEKFDYPFYFLPRVMNAVAPPYSDLCSPLLISTSADVNQSLRDAIPLVTEYGSSERLWYVPSRGRGVVTDIGTSLPAGATQDMAHQAHAFTLALAGWYPAEVWGVWSPGDSYLLFRKDDFEPGKTILLRLRMKVFAASSQNPKSITILMGDDVLWRTVRTTQTVFDADVSIDWPSKALGSVFKDVLVLQIRTSDPRSPAALDARSHDTRKLGVGLLSISRL